jgi:ubiquinol oxidase
VYLSLCVFLDVAFDRRPIQRFWFLESVARMPYFRWGGGGVAVGGGR